MDEHTILGTSYCQTIFQGEATKSVGRRIRPVLLAEQIKRDTIDGHLKARGKVQAEKSLSYLQRERVLELLAYEISQLAREGK